MSAVSGPSTMELRGDVSVPVMDLDGSTSTVGLTTPLATMPAVLMVADVRLLEVPGPALSTPPSMLLQITSAAPASGLLPRLDGRLVPISEIEPELMKAPTEPVGQVKPEGAAVSQ